MTTATPTLSGLSVRVPPKALVGLGLGPIDELLPLEHKSAPVYGRNAKGLKTVELNCQGCLKTYPAVLKEVTRAQKRGYRLYCSQTCRSFHTNRLDPTDKVALWVTEAWLQEAYADAYRSARKGSRKRGIHFDYSKDDYNEAIRACGNRCSLSGIAFENSEHVVRGDRRQFIPSIDRIDSSKGYTRDNIRIVCSIANLGMNTGGEGPLIRLATHLIAKIHGFTVEEFGKLLSRSRALKARNTELEARNAALEARLAAANIAL